MERQPDVMNQGLMERVRNFHDGALAKLAIAATFIGSGTTAELTANPTSVAADTAPTTVLTPEQQQQCIDAALARPDVLQAPTMYRAGIRPLTHYFSQTIRGKFKYDALPDYCGPAGLVRISLGEPQIFRNGHWGKATLSVSDPGYWGNQLGTATILDGPPHSFPEYIFNDPVKGENGYHFHKMREVIVNSIRDASTKKTIEQQRYIMPMRVYGNPARAIKSKREAQRKGYTRH